MVGNYLQVEIGKLGGYVVGFDQVIIWSCLFYNKYLYELLLIYF